MPNWFEWRRNWRLSPVNSNQVAASLRRPGPSADSHLLGLTSALSSLYGLETPASPQAHLRPKALYQSIIAQLWRGDKISTMANQGKSKLIAIVDDDDSMRSALQGLLECAELQSHSFASAEEFLKSGKQHQVACLIADIRMPGMSGLELQAHLNAERCRIPIIFITAHGDEKMRMQALRAGAVEFMTKPFNDEALLDSVRAALEN